MPVGRHHQAPAAGQWQQGAVVALAQVVVVEGAGEQLVDELRAGAPPGAVRHVHAALLEVDGTDVVFADAHADTTGMSLKRP